MAQEEGKARRMTPRRAAAQILHHRLSALVGQGVHPATYIEDDDGGQWTLTDARRAQVDEQIDKLSEEFRERLLMITGRHV